MEIKIAHLYYDLMNLYGENGNVKALVSALKTQDIDVSVYKLSIDDKIDFSLYDVFVIGSGTEENQIRVLNSLKTYEGEIKKAVEDGKFFLCTGNSIELFGKTIIDTEGNLYNCIKLFDFETTKLIHERLVCESLFKCNLIDKNILGFENREGKMANYDFNLFEVIRGIGNNEESKKEGIHYKNFYGTYLIGPLLVRNPEFLKYITKEIINSKTENFEFKEFDLELSEKAYVEFMKNHYPAYLE